MTPVRVLVATAVAAEAQAIQAGLGASGDEITVTATGVGLACAAANTATLLERARQAGVPFTHVLSMGIGGGLPGRAEVGEIVVARRSIAADLGAQSPTGFLSLSELEIPGLGAQASTIAVDAALHRCLSQVLPGSIAGDILTVATVTGSAARAEELARHHPDAVAEAMEGFAVACAARVGSAQAGGGQCAFAELRTISNPIGPRDRAAWRISDALAALTHVGQALAQLTASNGWPRTTLGE